MADNPLPFQLIRHAPVNPDTQLAAVHADATHAALRADIKRLKTLLAWSKHAIKDQRDLWIDALNHPGGSILTYDEARRMVSRLNGLIENLEKEDL